MPARYASQRLRGKLLLEVNGKTILQNVYDNIKDVDWADIWISAADDKIERAAQEFTDNVIRVNNTCCGTHSVYRAYIEAELNYDIIWNVQADNISLKKETLDRLYWYFCRFHFNGIVTAHYRSLSKGDENRVKVVIGNGNRAIYFSREAIPHNSKEYNYHVGVYGFWEDNLLNIGNNYDVYGIRHFTGENLEQLDWIYNGYSIYSFEVDPSISIDNFKDYENIKKSI